MNHKLALQLQRKASDNGWSMRFVPNADGTWTAFQRLFGELCEVWTGSLNEMWQMARTGGLE